LVILILAKHLEKKKLKKLKKWL